MHSASPKSLRNITLSILVSLLWRKAYFLFFHTFLSFAHTARLALYLQAAMLFPGYARKFPLKNIPQMAAGSVIGPGGGLAGAFTAQSYFRSTCNEGECFGPEWLTRPDPRIPKKALFREALGNGL